jgi:hypothetical protein
MSMYYLTNNLTQGRPVLKLHDISTVLSTGYPQYTKIYNSLYDKKASSIKAFGALAYGAGEGNLTPVNSLGGW